MPASGKRWRHVIISSHSSWLPGDARGWRSRNHKRHSSGDYKSPPPPGEHAGLNRYCRSLANPTVVFPPHLRPCIGLALVQKLLDQGCRVLVAAVAGQHAHLLAELPVDPAQTRQIVGRGKQAASHAVRDELPGTLWASGGKFKLVKDRRHQLRVYRYILKEQGSGAWTWEFMQKWPRLV